EEPPAARPVPPLPPVDRLVRPGGVELVTGIVVANDATAVLRGGCGVARTHHDHLVAAATEGERRSEPEDAPADHEYTHRATLSPVTPGLYACAHEEHLERRGFLRAGDDPGRHVFSDGEPHSQ